jgi:DNA repair exonuclease SbcCD ATPase subunit
VLELSNTKNKVTNIEKEVNDKYREKFNAFSEKRMSASIKYTNQISIDKDFRNSTKNEYDSAKNKKDLYDKSVQMRSVLDSKIVKQLADIEMVKKSTESTQKNVSIAEESKRLIKSYSLQKFQETLDAIGETASDILRNVPNMATASIYFEGCKETGSGTIKEEVTALVNMDGEPDIDIKSLSGGERTAIDLAVDLAVIDVLEVKAGKGADFFILDEPFDSLDSYNKIEFLQLLTNSNLNKRIIIVDHSSEVKEVTNDSVIVHRNGEFSCIL